MIEQRSARIRRVLVIGACVTLSLAGCTDTTAPSQRQVNATALTVPATAAMSAPLTADVVVQIGACEGFTGFKASRTASQIVLRAFARDTAPSDVACPAYLKNIHETYTAQPPFSGTLTVSVQQPDGSLLSQQVTFH